MKVVQTNLLYSYAAIGVGTPIALTLALCVKLPQHTNCTAMDCREYNHVCLTQVVLYDLILKNHEKLVHPRNSNTSSLY